MAEKWRLIHPNHINAIVDGYEATIEHFRDRVGFTLDRRIPDSGDGTDACLMTLGGVMFEFFAPKERGERGQGRLLARYGDHYIGIEYNVPDVTSAREFANEQGVRIINDLGAAFFTYPGNSFGIAFEIYDGDFSEHAQPAGYWENQHPLGLTGLARLTVAVESVEAAVARLHELAEVSPLGPVNRPRAAAKGVQLQVGTAVWEMLEPDGDGALADYLGQYGQRIRSTVFQAVSLSAVEKHLTAQGFDLIPGDADDALAIDPAQNKNLLFEFTE
jgi:glyoxalase/bleomycin resistance protein/dioxygenase superfamily protein